ncbi:MAG: hypothetical protein JEZ04_06900 [Spirochaetales bacterium]|nr:hypothetical protein [Spirochaetales bacterium]
MSRINALLGEKELILKEVHHRVKNDLNVINSLLSIEAEIFQDPAVAAAFQDTGLRVQSMMVLYDKLYMNADYDKLSVTEYFPSLIDEIISNFPNRSIVKTKKGLMILL